MVENSSAIRISQRIRKIKPSFTLEMAAKAMELRAQGVDVINFSVGEPDFNTPANIISAAKQAMDDGFTKYTAGAGMPELRQAICRKLARENGIDATLDQIVVSNGEKHSLYNACQTIFEDGDQVIIFKPYWVSFPEFVSLADAEAVFVNTLPDQRFEPDFDDLASKITDRTRGVIINTPSNPSGGVWSDAALRRLLELAAKHDWTVIADECYERLVYGDPFVSAVNLNQANARIITCMSLSKTYAMTGWRIGYSVSDAKIAKAMAKFQGQATSCPNSIGQKAAIEALDGDQSAVEKMRQTFQQRRDLMVRLLNEIPGISCALPGGAFYAFPNMSAYIGKKVAGKVLEDSFDLGNYLLEKAQVVTVPGDGFGAPGHIRFSFATNLENISEGINRIAKVLQELE